MDEAHGTEAEARRAFSQDILASTLLDWGKGLESESPKYNVYERAARSINSEEIDDKSTIFGLINKCKKAGKDLANASNIFANGFCQLLDFAPHAYGSYESCNVWINQEVRESDQFNALYKLAKDWYESAENLVTESSKVLAYLEDFKSFAVTTREISAFVVDIKEVMNSCDVIFFNNSDKYVYSAFLNRKKTIKQDKLTAELYSVSEVLNEQLYAKAHSIIFTSATLAMGDSFEAFKDSIGLSTDTREYQLASSFDFDKNMTIYIAKDLPVPNDPNFSEQLNPFLANIIVAGGGSVLALFTNRNQMEHAYEFVDERIKPENLSLLCQK